MCGHIEDAAELNEVGPGGFAFGEVAAAPILDELLDAGVGLAHVYGQCIGWARVWTWKGIEMRRCGCCRPRAVAVVWERVGGWRAFEGMCKAAGALKELAGFLQRGRGFGGGLVAEGTTAPGEEGVERGRKAGRASGGTVLGRV